MMLICQITLASYLSAAGQRRQALDELAAATSTAAEHHLADQESQGWLAQGLLHALDRRPLEAAEAYGPLRCRGGCCPTRVPSRLKRGGLLVTRRSTEGDEVMA